MGILDLFRRNNETAKIAKERLQIIVAHQRMQRDKGSININELQQKLIEVIAQYLHIAEDKVNVELEHDEDRSILEMNVALPGK